MPSSESVAEPISFEHELLRLLSENNELMKQNNRVVKDNNRILKEHYKLLINIEENVRKIKYNTN